MRAISKIAVMYVGVSLRGKYQTCDVVSHRVNLLGLLFRMLFGTIILLMDWFKSE